MFFSEFIISKEHPIGFRWSVIIEKQYLIIRIIRGSYPHVLKKFLNRIELFEIHFLEI